MAVRKRKPKPVPPWPVRGQVYRHGRRRFKITRVIGLDRRKGHWIARKRKGKLEFETPAVEWMLVDKNGRRRTGTVKRNGWVERLDWQGTTTLQHDGKYWRMPEHYTLEGS